jgi:hypothetical protein
VNPQNGTSFMLPFCYLELWKFCASLVIHLWPDQSGKFKSPGMVLHVDGQIVNTLAKKSALIYRVKQSKNSFFELLDPEEKGTMIF